ncbi:MAG: twin-arginine translocase TatA/TatE family subunit [Chloroflexi bacterium]|jgi:sec-independent protein translocase protein TatA|nr:MAG: twin-arginine translocase TatA/TatE family subunit [Chloroflexota bacterium]TMC20819.1 MAG: twin-arginine translocase TatA/TatE family subunit [Chloroflexota bacterium]TMC86199.1 MAG: twin-arginine translocase TatA/TatE family subunit [Chloroflexota bacterium]
MFGFHAPELIIILVVALLIFGPKRLPEMGAGVGKFIKEFRKGVNEISNPKEEKVDELKSPNNLEAIDREIASKKASYESQKNTDGEAVTRTTSSEPIGTESKVD